MPETFSENSEYFEKESQEAEADEPSGEVEEIVGSEAADLEEGGQSPEKIREVLETALKDRVPVNLVIKDWQTGRSNLAPDLYIDGIEGNRAMVTYLDENGEVGGGLTLELSDIQKIELK